MAKYERVSLKGRVTIKSSFKYSFKGECCLKMFMNYDLNVNIIYNIHVIKEAFSLLETRAQ